MKKIIDPVRLYLNNLVKCIGETEEVCDFIDDVAYEEVWGYIKGIKSFTQKYTSANGGAILPQHFVRFVRDRGKEKSGTPHYFLTRCHSNAAYAMRTLIARQDNYQDTGGCDKDQAVVEQFEKYINDNYEKDAGSISSRQLSRLIDLSAGPLSTNEETFIKFFFCTVVKVIDYDSQTFLSIIKEKTWVELLCWKDDKQLLHINDSIAKTELQQMFDDLYQLTEDSLNKVTEQLEKIYYYINTNRNIFSIYEENNTPSVTYIDDNDYIENFDAYISSHILYFMRWLPMISDEQAAIDDNYISLVEKIIDEIRDDLDDELKKEAKAEDTSCGGIFVKDKHKELRKKLIKIIHNIPELHTQFHMYYGIRVS